MTEPAAYMHDGSEATLAQAIDFYDRAPPAVAMNDAHAGAGRLTSAFECASLQADSEGKGGACEMRTLCTLGVIGLCLTWSVPGSAAVLCVKKSGAVVQREACKKKEKPIDLGALGKVPFAAAADSATNAANATHAAAADSATNAANATHAADADLLGGNPPSSFVTSCGPGSVALVANWYAPQLQNDPTYVAPNRYGGEGGIACNGGTPEMTKEGTGWYRMRVTPELPTDRDYLLFVNPDARGATPLYADGNSEFAQVWDVHVFDNNGNPADPYYMEVLLVVIP